MIVLVVVAPIVGTRPSITKFRVAASCSVVAEGRRPSSLLRGPAQRDCRSSWLVAAPAAIDDVGGLSTLPIAF